MNLNLLFFFICGGVTVQQLISISAQFPPQLEAAARIEAARQRISRAELVRRAVIEYLKQLEAIPASQPQQGGNNVQRIS